MADGTHISWADATWNIVTGCTRVSEGCDRCYIDRSPPFRIAGRHFDGPGIGATTGLVFHPERLDMPLRWKRPRRIFVNSLSDLFHDEVLKYDDGHRFPFLARAFARMVAADQHIFQVLTKRPGVMASVLRHPQFKLDVNAELLSLGHPVMPGGMSEPETPWPAHIWLGTSVENQKWAGVRIPALIDTPAAVRFLSVEPMLGPIDLEGWLFSFCRHPQMRCPRAETGAACPDCLPAEQKLSWVIVGGESGPGARPMDEAWPRRLQRQCEQAGVSYFFKQAGAVLAREWGCAHKAGADPTEWPEPFPQTFPAELVQATA